jgi:hypothetical protein
VSDTKITVLPISPNNAPASQDETRLPAGKTAESSLSSGSAVVGLTQGSLAIKHSIDIDRLWETAHGESSNVVRALELLKQTADYLSEARKNENPIDADRFVQRAQLGLPKLFALRSIGDGFGLLINSLYYASLNLRGTPMSHAQIDVVWRTLRELRTHPVISVEQAVQHVEELERCGLEPDPAGLGELLEDFESAEDA